MWQKFYFSEIKRMSIHTPPGQSRTDVELGTQQAHKWQFPPNCIPSSTTILIASCLASSPVPWANQSYWVCFTRHPNILRCVCLFDLQLELLLAQISNKHSLSVCMCFSVSYKQRLIFLASETFHYNLLVKLTLIYLTT